MSPKVTVLITTWNRAPLIGRAIESVQSQTFKDWEIIIVDDGSTDATERVVKEWQKKEPRIRYFKRPHVGRIAVVSNFGLKQARGEYIAILDDDDSWANEEKLKKQVEFLDKNSEYAGCGGGFIVIDKDGHEGGRFLKPERDEDIKKRALIANPMVNSTSLFRRKTAEKIGFYDETLPEFADWDFWLKMGLAGKLRNFQEYFAYYLMWGRGSSFSKQKGTAYSALKIVRRYKGKYPGFRTALIMSYLYYVYAKFPEGVKRFLNPVLSLSKKAIFSRF